MTLYPYTVGDTSPNALRSTFNPDKICIAQQPRRGNSGNHPEIVDGWCGTTNDICITALGEIDTDSEDWFDDLVAALPDDAELSRSAIDEWMNADYDPESEDCDFVVPAATGQMTKSAQWDEASEDGDYYPSARDGWYFAATYDTDSDIEHLSNDDRKMLERSLGSDDCVTAVEHICDLIGVNCDRVDHETYDSGTSGTDWMVLGVGDDDQEKLNKAMDLAVAIARIDDEATVEQIDAMLMAWGKSV